jgi:hypothetical protein
MAFPSHTTDSTAAAGNSSSESVTRANFKMKVLEENGATGCWRRPVLPAQGALM